jgi:DNA-directed RNA polymerase alpha subunit
MSELEPTPELPDDMPIREVQFPTLINNALFAAGMKTVGEVREMSDEALLSLPDFGKASVAQDPSTNITSGTTSKPSRWKTTRCATSCGAASSTVASTAPC